jgi:Cu-Zn family superoxide dismutase
MRNLMLCTMATLLLVLSPAFAEDAPKKEKAPKTESSHKGDKAHAPAPANATTNAICVLSATEGNTVTGWVKFTKQPDGVLIEAEVKGLTPGAKHGFHVHELGDISAKDGTATGGHYNPGGHDHAAPDADMRHVGDLGNIEANAEGVGTYSRLDKMVRLNGPKNNIIGRGIIVHAGTDDLSTQPTGNAGARIAQGVIGVAKAEAK